jgi:hypothetical protein
MARIAPMIRASVPSPRTADTSAVTRRSRRNALRN